MRFETRRLCVDLGGKRVLDDVSLTVESGEWCAVVGPNGAGKTTLLRALAGVVRPSSGTVLIDGTDVSQLDARTRARNLSYAPQVPTVRAEMPVAAFVALGRAPYWGRFGHGNNADAAAASEAMHAFDIAGLSARVMGSLSGGERQRAVLAQSLAQDAEVMVLDEPTTSLDLGHQQHLLETIDSLRTTRGTTVITSLHDLTLAGLYADRVLMLAGGRVVADGRPADVLGVDNITKYYGTRNVEVEERDGRVSVRPVRSRP